MITYSALPLQVTLFILLVNFKFFLVPTFVTLQEQKSKIIAKNTESTVERKNEKCCGVHIEVDNIDLWLPCLWRTVKDKDTCTIDNDKRLEQPRFKTYCFGCEGVSNNIQVNPKVKNI